MKLLLFTVLTVFQSAVMAQATDSILVVANASKSEKLTKEAVKEIFLGTRTFVGDWRVFPLDQEQSSAIRHRFYRLLTGKNPTEMKVYWAEQIFSGKARAPKAVADDQSVIQYINENPNAIGYVLDSTNVGKLQVILQLN